MRSGFDGDDGTVFSWRDMMECSSKILVMVFVCLVACVSVVSAQPVGNFFVGNTSDGGIVPTLIDFNAGTCAAMGAGCSGTFYKIDKSGETQTPTLYSGTYDLGNGETIKITATDGTTIAWESTAKVNCIFMKGGDGGDVYCYNPPKAGDSGLTTTYNQNGQHHAISHIVICYSRGTSIPEFPSLALPAAMMIGILGVVYLIKSREH